MMTQRNFKERFFPPLGVTRREFIKTAAYGSVLYCSVGIADDDTPPEPDNLDQATAWQEGDPAPREQTVPTVEPQQTSDEAPPSQPMEDDRGEQPTPSHKWVNGYWWWTDGEYVWVPGYWAVSPKPEWEYEAGYWEYQQTRWVYSRGGWRVMYTTSIVAYAHPRPVVWVWVIPAPPRIVRRHHSWHRRHHWRRQYRHENVGTPLQHKKQRAPNRRGGRRR